MVSVVVPVYNSEKSIERCANSILNQDYQDLELILVNDGSKDNSAAICDRLSAADSRVVVIHKENGGVSSARNVGIKNSNGDYITFVDSDDELVPNAISTVLNYINKYDADVVAYGWNRIDENTKDKTIICEEFELCDNKEIIIRRILENYSSLGGGYPWNKLWHRSCFKDRQIELFDTQLYYFEDLEWVIRMMMNINRLVVCPLPLYDYNLRSSSVTNDDAQSERREIGYHQSIWKTIEDLQSMPDVYDWFMTKYLPEAVNGVIHAKRNDWKSSEQKLLEYVKYNKSKILFQSKIALKIKLRCLVLLLFN